MAVIKFVTERFEGVLPIDLMIRTKGGLDGREQHWFAKSESQVLRLAGTLAYIDWAGSQGASSSIGIERIASSSSLELSAVDDQFRAARSQPNVHGTDCLADA